MQSQGCDTLKLRLQEFTGEDTDMQTCIPRHVMSADICLAMQTICVTQTFSSAYTGFFQHMTILTTVYSLHSRSGTVTLHILTIVYSSQSRPGILNLHILTTVYSSQSGQGTLNLHILTTVYRLQSRPGTLTLHILGI